jgi:hypothetical protein
MHARRPLPCALWEELDHRGRPTDVSVDDGELLGALHGLLMAHRAQSSMAR